MPSRATILFAFANPKKDLKLENEYNPIRKASYADEAQRIAFVPQAIFNTQIADLSTTFRTFKKQLAVFHFAGHGDHYVLSLQDKDVPTHPFNDLLALQPNLQLVFLNGCNTDLQARALVDKIPVVIGTNSVIDDEVASQFSAIFYEHLLANQSIEDSFRAAQSNIAMLFSKGNYRGSKKLYNSTVYNPANCWQLHAKNDEVKQWKLSHFICNQIDAQDLDTALRKMRDISSYVRNRSNTFHQLAHSHIEREATNQLLEWIKNPLKTKQPNQTPEEPIRVLAGNAGYGKTVIIKDVLDQLEKEEIPVLALKADMLHFANIQDIDQQLGLGHYFKHVFEALISKYGKLVILIDQIDALSQSLSTDRTALQTYQYFIDLLKDLGSGIRIITSCRIYDLNYDPLLQKFQGKQEIRVTALTKEQVLKVLKIKNPQINESQVPVKLLKLLAVPLHLDIYCRVYSTDLDLEALSSLQGLYNELWRQKILQAPASNEVNSQQLKQVLYTMANRMYDRQQISLAGTLLEDENPQALAYLNTQHLVVTQDHQVQFFHQSFFDYVFARCFVNAGKSISADIRSKHQGLFIRSKVRQVLAYLRGVDPSQFRREVEAILQDEVYRYHIKLLVINQLGFEEEPTPQEKRLVKEMIFPNRSFFPAFLESAQGLAWTQFILKGQVDFFDQEIIQQRYSGDVEGEDKVYYDLVIRLYYWICATKQHPENTDIILKFVHQYASIADRANDTVWVLYNLKDFTNPLSQQLFETFSKTSSDPYHILENATATQPQWVADQLFGLFKTYLNTPVVHEVTDDLFDLFKTNKESQEYFTVHEIMETYKKLASEAPEIAYQLSKEIIFYTIKNDKFKKNKLSYYTSYRYIGVIQAEEYNEEFIIEQNILSHLDQLAKDNPTQYQTEIKILLQHSCLNVLSLAFQSMIKNPELFVQEAYNCFINPDFLLNYAHTPIEHYTHVLLKVIYPYFSFSEQQVVNNNILSLVFPYEKRLPKRRPIAEVIACELVTDYGLRKYKLLSYLPDIERKKHPKVERTFQELVRKFKHSYESRSWRGGNITSAAPSLPQKAYDNLSVDEWIHSFRVYDNSKGERNYEKMDEYTHASNFTEEIAKNCDHFLPLIKRLPDEPDIPKSYLVAALEGLKKGKFNPTKFRQVFKAYINHFNFHVNHLHRLVSLIDYLIENNQVDGEIIEFLTIVMLVTPEEPRRKKNKYGIQSNDNVWTEGFNTLKGNALNKLMDCYDIDNFQHFIFLFLEKYVIHMGETTRVCVLHRSLAYLKNYDEVRTLHIFVKLMADYNEELLDICYGSLQYIYHTDFGQLYDFFDQVDKKNLTPKNFGIILFFAWLNDYSNAKELLFSFLRHKQIQVEAIGGAFSHLNDKNKSVREKCLVILSCFLTDDNKEVVEAYQRNFYKLNNGDFKNTEKFLFDYIQSPVGQHRDGSFYDYLSKCTRLHPEECITIIGYFKNQNSWKEGQYFNNAEDILEILTQSYNAIQKYDQESPVLKQAMDMFDQMLQKQEFRNRMTKVLETVDQ